MVAVLQRQTVAVCPSGAALGADIEGVDLSADLEAETVHAIEAAWSDHLVLRFRGQSLSDDELMRFTAVSEQVDFAPIAPATAKAASEGKRYINVVSGIM